MESRELSVTPLGTISTYCLGDDNCPGYLVQYGDQKVLLDCGNGISRHLKFPDDLNNLTIIISHLHPDHYGELLSIAQTSFVYRRLGYINERIKVYIPEGDIVKEVEHYTDTDGWGSSRIVEKTLIDFDYLLSLQEQSNLQFIPYKQSDRLTIPGLEVSFARNPHPIITYSTKIETDGVKFVYSSDTGYEGNSLEKFAYDSNLLICEATFLRGQIKNSDYHLYAYEAGKIALGANVDKLLLTHFWPSIDKQYYVDEAQEIFPNTEAAQVGKKYVLRSR